MADKTIGDLQAVSVGDLPLAPDIYDDTKIPVEQSGEAKHMTGAQWKAYAESAAAKSAAAAEQSAASAAESAAAASESADASEQARRGAEQARQGAEQAAIRQPIPDAETGTWWVWNPSSNAYTDSGNPYQGESGVYYGSEEPADPDINCWIDPSGEATPETDDTLTQSGKAADAKATGDQLRTIKSDLSDLAPAGAAVGQLFRVASISEDGKYTMEPVDLPAGGGSDEKYELITQITLAEEVSTLEIESDSSGAPINHKSIYLLMETPAATKAFSAYFWFYNKDHAAALNLPSTYIGNLYNTSKRYTSVLAIDSGSLRIFYHSNPAMDTRTPAYMSTLPVPDTTGYKIQSIRFRSMDASLGLLAGTKITVYGIR